MLVRYAISESCRSLWRCTPGPRCWPLSPFATLAKQRGPLASVHWVKGSVSTPLLWQRRQAPPTLSWWAYIYRSLMHETAMRSKRARCGAPLPKRTIRICESSIAVTSCTLKWTTNSSYFMQKRNKERTRLDAVLVHTLGFKCTNGKGRQKKIVLFVGPQECLVHMDNRGRFSIRTILLTPPSNSFLFPISSSGSSAILPIGSRI